MIRLVVIAALACASCTQTTTETASSDAAPRAAGDTTGAQCDANPVQSFVGQPGDQVTVAKIKSGSGARDVRRYATGAMLTMDFRADRVNVEVDAGGKIVKIGCG